MQSGRIVKMRVWLVWNAVLGVIVLYPSWRLRRKLLLQPLKVLNYLAALQQSHLHKSVRINHRLLCHVSGASLRDSSTLLLAVAPRSFHKLAILRFRPPCVAAKYLHVYECVSECVSNLKFIT